MIIHILFQIIIAITSTRVSGAIDSSVLDISKYNIGPKADGSFPKSYLLVTFSPDSHLKFRKAAYGPLEVWQSNDPNVYIEKAELGLSHCLPQLLSLHLTDGTNKSRLYFRWEKGNFMPESEAEFLSYNYIIKDEQAVLDTVVYLELDKLINTNVFNKGTKTIVNYHFDVISPKIDFKLIGVMCDSALVYRSDHSIKEVEVHRVSSKPKIIIVKDSNSQEPKRFIFDGIWKECDEEAAQQFLISVNTEESKKEDPVSTLHLATLSPSGIFGTVSDTPVTPVKLYTQEQFTLLNLHKELPSLPTDFVPATTHDQTLLVLDLNDVPKDFEAQDSTFGNLTVTKIPSLKGNTLFQVVESGCLVWNNENRLTVTELALYKINKLVVALILKLQGFKNSPLFFLRKSGKLSKSQESEFKHLENGWKQGVYDNTVTFSIDGPINENVFNPLHSLLDGVYVLTIAPKDGFQVVRASNGAADLVRPEGEVWKSFNVSTFGPINKLLTITIEANGKKLVKYYNCSSSFEELDLANYLALFENYKSKISIHSDVIFDLSNPKIALHANLGDAFTELVPNSGFHVKMVTFGNSVVWKSRESRCTSFFLFPQNKPTIFNLTISTNGNLSQLSFRILGEKLYKIKTYRELKIIRDKIDNEIRNPENEPAISKITYDGSIKYEPIVFDILSTNQNVLSHSTLEHIVTTVYAAKRPYSFKEIKFGDKVLWKSESPNSFVTKFVVYFLEGIPALGKLNVVNQWNYELVHFDFTGDSPNLIQPQDFEDKHNHLREEFLKTEIKPATTKPLDILDFKAIKAIPSRHQGLFNVEYSLNDGSPFDLLLYGPEIIWASENGEKASKVNITFYERVPFIALLTMENSQQVSRFLSHILSLWHDFDSSTLDYEYKKLNTYEPYRNAFTLPYKDESTDCDTTTNLDEFFTKRSFQSSKFFITTLLDGRNRLYTPDTLSYIYSLNLYYHGQTPKLASFREFSLFGYDHDHHFIQSNGWRRVSFAKFEQLYNFFRLKRPRGLCKENDFVYDILKEDPKVAVIPQPDQQYCTVYAAIEPGKSMCSVRLGDKVLWNRPENLTLVNFFLYKDGNNPVLAKFRMEDDSQNLTEFFSILKGSEWVTSTYADFSNALNQLVEKNLPTAPSKTVSVTPQPVPSPIKKPTQPPMPEVPAGTFALDISVSNDPNFQQKSGRCDKVVSFKEFKPLADKIVKFVKDGQKVVWFDPNYSLVCLKVFLDLDKKPLLMELLLKDKLAKQKYKFLMFDGNRWDSCDETTFDDVLDALIDTYKATT